MQSMSRSQAALEIALLQVEANSISSSDLYIWLRECGLPSEIAVRLKDLIGVTRRIGDKLVCVGKLIIVKLMEFIKKHPGLVVGVAVGAVLSTLIVAIPFLGPLLAPIAIPLGVTVGAVSGHRIDTGISADEGTGLIHVTQDVIEIVQAFFQLFIETFQALTDEIKQG